MNLKGLFYKFDGFKIIFSNGMQYYENILIDILVKEIKRIINGVKQISECDLDRF